MRKETEVVEIKVMPAGDLVVVEQVIVREDDDTIVVRGPLLDGRHILPGTDVSAEPARVQAVAMSIHTEECIAEWRATHPEAGPVAVQ